MGLSFSRYIIAERLSTYYDIPFIGQKVIFEGVLHSKHYQL